MLPFSTMYMLETTKLGVFRFWVFSKTPQKHFFFQLIIPYNNRNSPNLKDCTNANKKKKKAKEPIKGKKQETTRTEEMHQIAVNMFKQRVKKEITN